MLIVGLAACDTDPTAPPEVRPEIVPQMSSFAGTTWSTSGPGSMSGTTHPSGSVTLNYFWDRASYESFTVFTFTATAQATGPITFNFTINSHHGWYLANGNTRIFANGPSGQQTVMLATGQGPQFGAAGSATITLHAGYTFGVRVEGSNFDCCAYLGGTIILAPADNSPPVITPTVTGTAGSNGWYTSDVGVSWSVTDAQSAISSSTGCGASSLTTDSNGTTYTCSATSAGGTSTQSVTVKRDATVPTVTYSGNAGSYSVDQNVSISCTPADALSGVAASTCANISGAGYSFALGTNTYSATATDNAGNSGSGSTSFTVTVSPASLANVVNAILADVDVRNALVAKLDAAAKAKTDSAKKGQINAFINQVNAQRGKKLTDAQADLLIALANAL